MPVIRELNAPDTGLQTSTQAVSAFQQLARRQEVMGSELGQAIGTGAARLGQSVQGAYDYTQTQQEISKGSAVFATTNANLTDQWNTIAKNTDPNDNSIAGKFLAPGGPLDKALNDFVDGFNTPKGHEWAQAQADSLRQHWYEKTTADTATRAASATQSNFNAMVNGLAASASDPHSLDQSLAMSDSAVTALVQSSPGLSADAAGTIMTTLKQQAREHITEAGLTAMANANPPAFIAQLENGDFQKYTANMPPTFDKQLRAYAETQLKTQNADAKAAIALQTKAEDDQAKGAATDLIARTVASDGTLQLPKDYFTTTTQKLAVMPGAQRDPSLVKSVIDYGRTIQKDLAAGVKPTTVPEVYSDFRARAVLPDNDPNKLTEKDLLTARADHQLSDTDFRNLNALVTNKDPNATADTKQLQEFLLGAKPAVVGGTAGLALDPYQASRWAQFQSDMQARFDAGRQRGIPAQELLDPTNKNYLLGPGSQLLARYAIGLTQPNPGPGGIAPTLPPLFPQAVYDQLGDQVKDEQGIRETQLMEQNFFPAPRQPGESVAAYLARTGAK